MMPRRVVEAIDSAAGHASELTATAVIQPERVPALFAGESSPISIGESLATAIPVEPNPGFSGSLVTR